MDKAHYFFIILGLVLMVIIFNAIRKRKLSIDLSLVWIFGAILIFLLGCFPDSINYFAQLVGVVYPPSLLFLLAFCFLLILLLTNTLVISDLKDKNRQLIQAIALLDERLRKLEEKK